MKQKVGKKTEPQHAPRKKRGKESTAGGHMEIEKKRLRIWLMYGKRLGHVLEHELGERKKNNYKKTNWKRVSVIIWKRGPVREKKGEDLSGDKNGESKRVGGHLFQKQKVQSRVKRRGRSN